MRATQTYTAQFGRRVAALHRQSSRCLSTFLKHDKARRSVYSTCPVQTELESSMSTDLWPDAELDGLTAFVKRRLSKMGWIVL